jgi:protease I
MSRVVVIIGNEYEDSEFEKPVKHLRSAGHEISILGKKKDDVIAGKRHESETRIETTAQEADLDDYDAMLIPGGHSPDNLRLDEDIVKFVRNFVQSGKPVAVVCHRPQLLIEAGVVQGRTLTSWPSVRTDLINAGAEWADREVVEDGNLITSRKPDDLEAFSKAFLQRLESGAAREARRALR